MNAPARVEEDHSVEPRKFEEVEGNEWLEVMQEYELEGLGAD
jgi:hypothetical protein